MAQEQWSAVDQYLNEMLLEPDAALDHALAASKAAGLPQIQVAPNQGKLLHLIARIHGAKKILEVGTLGGYSTIWLARALPPGGKLVTLEYVAKHAEVAIANIAQAGLSDRVDVRVGRAIDLLPGLTGSAPFDLIFIDADKESTAEYYDWALKLTRPGGLIIVDNVVRNGTVVQTDGKDKGVAGVRKFMEKVKGDKRVSATAVQTVGGKGYDGLAVVRVE